MTWDGGRRRLRVVVFAFACSPRHGSEAASCWGTVNALSEVADVVALNRPGHSPYIAEHLRRHPNPHLRFVEVPEVGWGRRLHDHLRGTPDLIVWRLRYLGWLANAKRTALRLHAEEPFDVGVHSALGISWLPSPIVDLPFPSVWGPVSGAARSPLRLMRFLGVKGAVSELAEAAVARTAGLAPQTRRTWRRATVRLADSEGTRRRLPRRLRPSTRLVNRSGLAKLPDLPDVQRQSYLAFTSPLEPRKGPRLALHALAHTPPEVRLVFVHDGPEAGPLRKLAVRLGVVERVEFRGKVPRDEMFKAVAEAAAVVFTGLADDGSSALAEAMLGGAPVIVLGAGGARIIADQHRDPSRITIVEPGSASDTVRRLAQAMAAHSARPSTAKGPYLDAQAGRRRIQQAVLDAHRLASGTERSAPPTPASSPW